MIIIFAVALLLLRAFYSVAEVWFERDWPRRTWRGLALSLGLLALCASAFGSTAARVDQPILTYGPNVPTSIGPLPQTLWAANSTVYLCSHPSASLAACQASPIVTYTDATEGTACTSPNLMVQLPGNTCTSSSGVAANVGFWYAGGIVDYWVVSSYGTFGPFSINSSSGTASNPAAPAYAVQFANSSVSAFQADPNILINPILHTMNFGGALPATHFNFTNLSTIPSTWTFDYTTPYTAFASIGGPSGCTAWRGVINIVDCGAVADGAWLVAGSPGCGLSYGCWASSGGHGITQDAALRNAITGCGTTACVITFPLSGTNVWMFGGFGTDDCALAANGSGTYTLFNLPNNITIQGQGKFITTLMTNPGNAMSEGCSWFQNTNTTNMSGIAVNGMRLDGNEQTDSIHNDYYHPNNGGSGSAHMQGWYFQTGAEIGGPAFAANDDFFSGMGGAPLGWNGWSNFQVSFLLTGSSYAQFNEDTIYFNEWGVWVMANPDNQVNNTYVSFLGEWNGEDGFQLWGGGTLMSSAYFGGATGGNSALLLLHGVQGVHCTSCVFDNSQKGLIRIEDNGSAYSTDNVFNNLVLSQPGIFGASFTASISGTTMTVTAVSYGTIIVGSLVGPNITPGTAITVAAVGGGVGTYTISPSQTVSSQAMYGNAWPEISVAGHSYGNKFSTVWVNTGPSAVSSWAIQETDEATNNTYNDFTFDNTGTPFGMGTYQLAAGSTSKVTGALGIGIAVNDTGYTTTGITIGSDTVPVVAAPTVGNTACIKSAGPPVVIGYCSTVVNSSGACTCN